MCRTFSSICPFYVFCFLNRCIYIFCLPFILLFLCLDSKDMGFSCELPWKQYMYINYICSFFYTILMCRQIWSRKASGWDTTISEIITILMDHLRMRSRILFVLVIIAWHRSTSSRCVWMWSWWALRWVSLCMYQTMLAKRSKHLTGWILLPLRS